MSNVIPLFPSDAPETFTTFAIGGLQIQGSASGGVTMTIDGMQTSLPLADARRLVRVLQVMTSDEGLSR